MKYLPIVTLILWIAMVVCYYFAKTFLFNPYILFPLFTLISIMLPISFWCLQFTGKRLISVLFIGMLCVDCYAIGFQLYSLAGNLVKIEPYRSRVVDPVMADQRLTAENEKKRINMSRYIFENTGMVTLYKTKDGEFQLFTPTDLDMSTMYMSQARHSDMIKNKQFIIYYFQGACLLLFIHIAIFIGVLIYLVLLEGPATKRKLMPVH